MGKLRQESIRAGGTAWDREQQEDEQQEGEG